MKRTDLEKHKALKIVTRMQQDNPAAARHGAQPDIDRREQRKRDQALGLVPFAVKLESILVEQLRTLAEARKVPMNQLVGELLRKGIAAPAGT